MAARKPSQQPSRIKKGEDPAVPRPEPVHTDPPERDLGAPGHLVGRGLLGGAVDRQLQQEANIKEVQRIQRIGRNR